LVLVHVAESTSCYGTGLKNLIRYVSALSKRANGSLILWEDDTFHGFELLEGVSDDQTALQRATLINTGPFMGGGPGGHDASHGDEEPFEAKARRDSWWGMDQLHGYFQLASVHDSAYKAEEMKKIRRSGCSEVHRKIPS
jgi:hypothetical protein